MHIVSARRLLPLAAAAAILASLTPLGAAQAQYVYGQDVQQAVRRESRLTPKQKEQMFRAHKAWKSQSYKRRIAILERDKRCSDNATNASEFGVCKRKRQEARRALGADRRAYLNPVRRKVGLPPLEAPQRGRRDKQTRGRRA